MIKQFFLVVITILTLASCKKPEGNTGTFDRKLMLKDMAERIIAPSYSTLKLSTDTMQAAYVAFEAAPSITSLEALQDAFEESYVRWQYCSPFEFGPAMDVALRSSVNIFPTSPVKIENNITSGSYDLATAANVDAKGYPAIDYLLFADDAATTLANLQGNANRMDYLEAVINEISSKVTTVNNGWQNGYITTFYENDGTAAGSSLSDLVNQLNFDWEIIKTAKLGIPLGKKSLGIIYPEKVEAYYSGISNRLALNNAQAIAMIFEGKVAGDNIDVLSLDNYLKALGTMHNDITLDQAIIQQMDAALAALEDMPHPLSDAVQNNPALVDAAYIEVQKTVVLLKTDMPSALGVLITYQDNDGD